MFIRAMNTGFDTSEDWIKNESGIAIWPIGSFEQHGQHLPLLSDSIQANYFSEVLAKHFSAVLLPTQNFGTSLEHKGFRGTISLTASIFMDLIRCVLLQLEDQGFKFCILLNNHGGNFCLGPSARQFNSENRALKVIFLNAWEFSGFDKLDEIHGGEFETSVLKAIAPTWVRKVKSGPEKKVKNAMQQDLNHFGIGRISPNGIWGDASRSSTKKGRDYVKRIEKNMVGWIEERMEWFRVDPRYEGGLHIAIREVKRIDHESIYKIKGLVEWNGADPDKKLFTGLSTKKILYAFYNGKVVGALFILKLKGSTQWSLKLLFDKKLSEQENLEVHQELISNISDREMEKLEIASVYHEMFNV